VLQMLRRSAIRLRRVDFGVNIGQGSAGYFDGLQPGAGGGFPQTAQGEYNQERFFYQRGSNALAGESTGFPSIPYGNQMGGGFSGTWAGFVTECYMGKTGWMSDHYDPRVVYAKEPWNNPLKATTGHAGMPPEHKWRKKMITLCTSILDEVRMVPEHTIFRQYIENIYREYLRIVTNVGDTDWRIVERKIGQGQIEQILMYTMDEREQVQNYAEWKLWLIPMETIRELQDEIKSDTYFDFAGPPDPYLSDEEISDLKKIDQQRMAEEQKMLAARVKKLTGKSSRMLADDREWRAQKKAEYEKALQDYYRETVLDRAYTLYSDGTVKAGRDAQGENPIQHTRLGRIGALQANPADSMLQSHDLKDTPTQRLQEGRRLHLFTNITSFEESAKRKTEIITDMRESVYFWRGSRGRALELAGVRKGHTADEAARAAYHSLDFTEATMPMRLKLWDARKKGLIEDLPDDTPRGAPATMQTPSTGRGKLIPKWKKPKDVLSGGQEAAQSWSWGGDGDAPAPTEQWPKGYISSQTFGQPTGPPKGFRKWSDEMPQDETPYTRRAAGTDESPHGPPTGGGILT